MGEWQNGFHNDANNNEKYNPYMLCVLRCRRRRLFGLDDIIFFKGMSTFDAVLVYI